MKSCIVFIIDGLIMEFFFFLQFSLFWYSLDLLKSVFLPWMRGSSWFAKISIELLGDLMFRALSLAGVYITCLYLTFPFFSFVCLRDHFFFLSWMIGKIIHSQIGFVNFSSCFCRLSLLQQLVPSPSHKWCMDLLVPLCSHQLLIVPIVTHLMKENLAPLSLNPPLHQILLLGYSWWDHR